MAASQEPSTLLQRVWSAQSHNPAPSLNTGPSSVSTELSQQTSVSGHPWPTPLSALTPTHPWLTADQLCVSAVQSLTKLKVGIVVTQGLTVPSHTFNISTILFSVG